MQSGRADILCSRQMFYRGFAWEQVPEVISQFLDTCSLYDWLIFIFIIWIIL